MDVLILSCGTGGGHDAAARAMLEAMQQSGHRATMMNPFSLRGEAVERRVNQMYISTVQRAAPVFGVVYQIGQAFRRVLRPSPVYWFNRKAARLLGDYLAEHHTDVVITTHPFPGLMLTWLHNHGVAVPCSIQVATDYVCTPFSEEPVCDAYVIPSEDLRGNFEQYGLPAEKLYPLGIPVSNAFRSEKSKPEARQQLNLDTGEQYMLLSGGSIGAGKLEKIIRMIDQERQVDGALRMIIICGNNDALYQRLSAQYGQRDIILRSTDRMADYMRACDVFLCKPGGLSSTEAAVAGIPLGHLPGIPGCETCNREYFASRGMSLPVRDDAASVHAVLAMLRQDSVCRKMAAAQHKHIPADAAANIVALAEKLNKKR